VHGGVLHAEGVHTPRTDIKEELAMAHNTRYGSGHNGHSVVDRDRLRAEIFHLETALHYWQARWHLTPGPSDPGMPRHRIQQVIDLLHRELALKQGIEPS
jgi:hypothetical protein